LATVQDAFAYKDAVGNVEITEFGQSSCSSSGAVGEAGNNPTETTTEDQDDAKMQRLALAQSQSYICDLNPRDPKNVVDDGRGSKLR
jgi:hypothetical protein